MSGNEKTTRDGVKEGVLFDTTVPVTENVPVSQHIAGYAEDERGSRRQHLQAFDYVTTPGGNGVVIHNWPDRIGVILDAPQEVVYFERPEDIEQIRPVSFVSVPPSSGERRDVPCQEDEYSYLDPYRWPYNDPDMTDEYLIACGFPTREAKGHSFPTKPPHIERLRRSPFVLTPKGRGKLWRNWDTQIGVILDGTQRVTFFHTPEEWEQIVPLDAS